MRNDIGRARRAVNRVDRRTEQQALIADSTLAAVKEVPDIEDVAYSVSLQVKGLGDKGARELLFKLWMFLEENDAAEELARE